MRWLRRPDWRAGATGPVFALALPMLTAGVGFTVDGAAMRLAQARLQVAADAAAAAASRKLASNPGGEAVRVAALNLPEASNGTVLVADDVKTGTWSDSTRSFTAGGSNPNAINVTTRYAAANGNAHRLSFAAVLGLTSVDVSASAMAICPGNPTLSQISSSVPTAIRVVTQGQPCLPQSGLTGTCYWSTPQGNPIIRVDNWNAAETVITVRITSPAQYAGTFDFTAPRAGQFWVVVPNIRMSNTGHGGPVTNIVFKVQGSNPVVPASRINTTGTATYNNRFNATVTLPGTALCAASNQAGASRLVE